VTDGRFEIRRSQLAGQIYEVFRQMMEADVFKAGERVIERELAKRLDVSRTPVREALFRLEADGLVEQQRGKFVISRLKRRDIREIFQIRRLLEPHVVADIASRITDADLRKFIRARAAVVHAKDAEEAIKANEAFRHLWVSQIDNRRLLETLVKFHDQARLARRATLIDPRARAVAEKGVCDLVDGFTARDPDQTRKAMEDFIDAGLMFFEAAVDEIEDTRN